jgi:hypothetical protein
MSSEIHLLTTTYQAFNARDVDAVLHPEVDWNGMEGGRMHGHAGVREYWTRQWSLVDPHVEPRGFRPTKRGGSWSTCTRSSATWTVRS